MTVPANTWGYVAARVYEVEQRKGRRVYDRRRFEDAVAVDAIRRYSDLAEHWLRLFDVTPARLAEALVDGMAPRYATRRDT